MLILADDMGWSDLGCYGGEIPTPHLDALAGGGLRFTQFYNTARCSPTRAALLTGLYPHQAGMGYLDGMANPESRGTWGRLAERAVTVADLLGESGAFTAVAGKWHLGHGRGSRPEIHGFQRSLVSPAGGLYFPRQTGGKGARKLFVDGVGHEPTDPRFGEDWYSTSLFTDWGLRYIDEARAAEKPFFLYLPFCAPHFPLMAPADTIARFAQTYDVGWDRLRAQRLARQIELGLVPPDTTLAPRPPEVPAWADLAPARQQRFSSMMAVYAAMIAEVDANVGRLVEHLRATGELDHTLLLFLSDNGGNAESGPDGTLRGPGSAGDPDSTVFLGMTWATLNNTPFRRYKHFTHEGGIRTPLIVHWPAGIPAARRGALVTDPAHVVDVLPTVLDLHGVSYPATHDGHTLEPVAGVSLLRTFDGQPLARPEPLFFAHEGNKAVRDGRWKAVQPHLGAWELYDLATDPTELLDLAPTDPDRLAGLRAQWNDWAERTHVDPWEGGLRQPWGAPVRPE